VNNINDKVCGIEECVDTNKENTMNILDKVCNIENQVENCDGEGDTINVNVTCNGNGDEGPPGGGPDPCEDCPCECPPGIIPDDPCETFGNVFETEGADGDEYVFWQRALSKSRNISYKKYFLASSAVNDGESDWYDEYYGTLEPPATFPGSLDKFTQGIFSIRQIKYDDTAEEISVWTYRNTLTSEEDETLPNHELLGLGG
jgi:hypothetical protein